MWSVGIEVFTVLSMFCTSVGLQLNFIEKMTLRGCMSVEKSSQYSRCFVVGLQWDFIEEMLFQGGMSVQKSSQYPHLDVLYLSAVELQCCLSGQSAPFGCHSIVSVVRMHRSAATALF